MSCAKVRSLPESLQEVVDELVEISILLPHAIDLPDGVNDRRMMLASEAASDFWERCICQRLAEVHGNLTRRGDRLRVIA